MKADATSLCPTLLQMEPLCLPYSHRPLLQLPCRLLLSGELSSHLPLGPGTLASPLPVSGGWLLRRLPLSPCKRPPPEGSRAAWRAPGPSPGGQGGHGGGRLLRVAGQLWNRGRDVVLLSLCPGKIHDLSGAPWLLVSQPLSSLYCFTYRDAPSSLLLRAARGLSLGFPEAHVLPQEGRAACAQGRMMPPTKGDRVTTGGPEGIHRDRPGSNYMVGWTLRALTSAGLRSAAGTLF